MLNGEKVLDEMNTFELNAVQAAPGQRSGDDDLPFESLDDYSTDPIGFEEVTDMVSNKVRYIFSLSAKYNHRSPDYLEVCGILERGIKYLGSCCLTGVLLKQKGYELPKLEDLSTHWLYGMTSFNIRKLNRTADEELSRSGAVPSKWLDMLFRYINLAERLKSTETKIFEYANYYWLDKDKFVKRALMFSENAYNRVFVAEHVKKPDFRLAPSFPMLSEVTGSGSPVSEKNAARKAESEKSEAQHSVPGTQQPAAGDYEACSPAARNGAGRDRRWQENTQSADSTQHSVPGTFRESGENEAFEVRDEKCGQTAEELPDLQEETDRSVFPSGEDISHSEESVPAFMAILERAAERSKDDKDGGLHFTLKELDTLACDPEFRQFDPDLANVICRKHAELFPGINST